MNTDRPPRSYASIDTSVDYDTSIDYDNSPDNNIILPVLYNSQTAVLRKEKNRVTGGDAYKQTNRHNAK
jgi:hypothetical protein